MAGPHQIWKMDLGTNEVATFAGSGREERKDGPLLEAGFAQPSGITTDGFTLGSVTMLAMRVCDQRSYVLA